MKRLGPDGQPPQRFSDDLQIVLRWDISPDADGLNEDGSKMDWTSKEWSVGAYSKIINRESAVQRALQLCGAVEREQEYEPTWSNDQLLLIAMCFLYRHHEKQLELEAPAVPVEMQLDEQLMVVQPEVQSLEQHAEELGQLSAELQVPSPRQHQRRVGPTIMQQMRAPRRLDFEQVADPEPDHSDTDSQEPITYGDPYQKDRHEAQRELLALAEKRDEAEWQRLVAEAARKEEEQEEEEEGQEEEEDEEEEQLEMQAGGGKPDAPSQADSAMDPDSPPASQGEMFMQQAASQISFKPPNTPDSGRFSTMSPEERKKDLQERLSQLSMACDESIASSQAKSTVSSSFDASMDRESKRYAEIRTQAVHDARRDLDQAGKMSKPKYTMPKPRAATPVPARARRTPMTREELEAKRERERQLWGRDDEGVQLEIDMLRELNNVVEHGNEHNFYNPRRLVRTKSSMFDYALMAFEKAGIKLDVSSFSNDDAGARDMANSLLDQAFEPISSGGLTDEDIVVMECHGRGELKEYWFANMTFDTTLSFGGKNHDMFLRPAYQRYTCNLNLEQKGGWDKLKWFKANPGAKMLSIKEILHRMQRQDTYKEVQELASDINWMCTAERVVISNSNKSKPDQKALLNLVSEYRNMVWLRYCSSPFYLGYRDGITTGMDCIPHLQSMLEEMPITAPKIVHQMPEPANAPKPVPRRLRKKKDRRKKGGKMQTPDMMSDARRRERDEATIAPYREKWKKKQEARAAEAAATAAAAATEEEDESEEEESEEDQMELDQDQDEFPLPENPNVARKFFEKFAYQPFFLVVCNRGTFKKLPGWCATCGQQGHETGRSVSCPSRSKLDSVRLEWEAAAKAEWQRVYDGYQALERPRTVSALKLFEL